MGVVGGWGGGGRRWRGPVGMKTRAWAPVPLSVRPPQDVRDTSVGLPQQTGGDKEGTAFVGVHIRHVRGTAYVGCAGHPQQCSSITLLVTTPPGRSRCAACQTSRCPAACCGEGGRRKGGARGPLKEPGKRGRSCRPWRAPPAGAARGRSGQAVQGLPWSSAWQGLHGRRRAGGVCVWVGVAVAKAGRVRRVLGGLFSMGQSRYVNVGQPPWSCGSVMIGRGSGERRRKPPCAEYVVPRIGLRMAESGGQSPRPHASGYALGLGADRLGRQPGGRGGGGERGEWSRGHAATAPSSTV